MSRRRGQTTVEFSLICLPFFAILFALVDYAQIYFYENSLQNALREASRFATAGRVIQATVNGVPQYETNTGGIVVPKAITDSAGREASRNECIRYWFNSNCIVHIPLSDILISNAATLPGVEPSLTTNIVGRITVLTLVSGFNVTRDPNSGTYTTNVVPAEKGPGAENNYIQITATYTIGTITPLFGFLGGYSRGTLNSFPVYVSAIVKNEPATLNFEKTNMYSDEP